MHGLKKYVYEAAMNLERHAAEQARHVASPKARNTLHEIADIAEALEDILDFVETYEEHYGKENMKGQKTTEGDFKFD